MSIANIKLHIRAASLRPSHLAFHVRGIGRELRKLITIDLMDLLTLPLLIWAAYETEEEV